MLCTKRGEAVTQGARRQGRIAGHRPGRVPFVAGVFAAFVAQGTVGALVTLPDSAYLQWSGVLESRTLDDGSVLNEYVALTGALGEPDVTLSIRFVPRFECSPLIGLRIAGTAAADTASALEDGSRATIVIDGEALELAFLVDAKANVTTLWVDADVASRERLRRRIDIGSRIELELPDDRTVAFSLLGSKRSAAVIESACLGHEPAAYEAD